MTTVTLPDLLMIAPSRRPQSSAQQHVVFCERALALAGGLQARGLRSIAAHVDDAFDLACLLFGAWRAGVRVTLPGDALPNTVARLAADVQCWVGDAGVPGMSVLADLSGTPLPAARLDPQAECLVLATSGSSGEPKLIAKTLRQLASEVAVLEALWGAELGDATVVGSVSTQHIYGLLFRVLWPLSAGRAIDGRQRVFAEDIQQASLPHDHVAWIASPALLKRMGDNLDWPVLGARVAKVFSSGGALPASSAQALAQRLGRAPVEIYGSSETGGVGWRQGGVLWTTFPGSEIGQSEDSALWVRSPYLPEGHTEQMADAVRLHAGGFELLDRLDRIVKLEEKRVSLPRIERLLVAHEWVDDARLGMIQKGRAYLGALVALNEVGVKALRGQGRRVLVDTLRQMLAGEIEELALPRRWRFVRRLDTNAQGKLRQVDVDAQLQAARPSDPIVKGLAPHEDGLRLDLEVPLDLAHFSGHFATTPVVPGVLQIGWAIDLARQHLDPPPRFVGMEVIKFQRLLRPGDTMQLELRFDDARSKLHFSYRSEGEAHSSGRILLGACDA